MWGKYAYSSYDSGGFFIARKIWLKDKGWHWAIKLIAHQYAPKARSNLSWDFHCNGRLNLKLLPVEWERERERASSWSKASSWNALTLQCAKEPISKMKEHKSANKLTPTAMSEAFVWPAFWNVVLFQSARERSGLLYINSDKARVYCLYHTHKISLYNEEA